MKASDLFVKALENEGVDRIFAVPGEENLDVLESLRRSSIQLVLTRHEQSAAFMAATHGRLTGRPGVCMATLGPGALNLVTGAAYAHLGAMPMILITGQKAIMTARQARFQIVDIVATMKPLTKAVAPDRQRGEHPDAWCAMRSVWPSEERPRSGAPRTARGRGGRAACPTSIARGRRCIRSRFAAAPEAGAIAARRRPADGRQAAAGDVRRRLQPPAPERPVLTDFIARTSASPSSTPRWARARSAGIGEHVEGATSNSGWAPPH